MKLRLLWVAILCSLGACSGSTVSSGAGDQDPPQVTIGERLFLETRFAQFQAANGVDANAVLAAGDPVVDQLPVSDGSARTGPFAGQSMNCRQCHLVDEALDANGEGMRTYADFAQRSPVPSRVDRGDTQTLAPRNSPALVNASLARDGAPLFHFDGEFGTLEELVTATMLGRNYGWLPDELGQATVHVARVIREDDGTGALAVAAGGSYRRVLLGTDPALPAALALPPDFRIDVSTASDAQIVAAVARLISVYVRQLEFSRDANGINNGSPYDLFLLNNHLPRAPASGEAPVAYARRLRAMINDGRALEKVPAGARAFAFHPGQAFAFGEAEIAGLRAFLDETRGNCIACHAPPDFTDFGLHNTGATQDEFDSIHGDAAFAALPVPTLAQRNANPAPYLPASAAHPFYRGVFRSVPTTSDPVATDLGVWSIFANPDLPARQAGVREKLCADTAPTACAEDSALLDLAIGSFKTPGLRDLGHSAPYLHTGREDTLRDVLRFYQRTSAAARAGTLRNADSRLPAMLLMDSDVDSISQFLEALNEDYS
jgi:cytochrome c peroxidase